MLVKRVASHCPDDLRPKHKISPVNFKIYRNRGAREMDKINGQPENLGEALRWVNQPVSQIRCPLGEVGGHIPSFSREPLAKSGGVNKYMDLIFREPIGDDTCRMPVATVSPRYALIQHSQVYNWLRAALRDLFGDADNLIVDLYSSPYWERLQLAVWLPELDFDPGDGHPITVRLEMRNSVDRSCAFEVRFRWVRIICWNGLFDFDEARLRKIHHLDWMNRRDPVEFIRKQISCIPEVGAFYGELMATPVSIPKIYKWAEKELRPKWGVEAAARVCHICETGYDGLVQHVGRRKLEAHEYAVSSDKQVPGLTPPINNCYHLAQVLSWMAGRQQDVGFMDKRTRDIARLIRPLMSLDQRG